MDLTTYNNKGLYPMSCTSLKLAFKNTKRKQKILMTNSSYYLDDQRLNPLIEHSLERLGPNFQPFPLPCGACQYCLLKRAKQWAIRCTHEASQHKDNMFLTLTYNEKHLPANATFNFSHTKKFMKKLRKHICEETGCYRDIYHSFYFKKTGRKRPTPKLIRGCVGACPKIKSFGCAEYGEKGGRPHYHLLIFGYRFPDSYKWKLSENPRMKCMRYRSKSLEKCWDKGYSELGSVTMQSAGYVARYVTKKNKSKEAIQSILGRFHEKSICVSRREGIGLSWLKRYFNDIYASDILTYKNRKGDLAKMKPPAYYDRKVEQLGLVDFPKIKLARQHSLSKLVPLTTKQAQDAAYLLGIKTKELVRNYENKDNDNA